MTRAELEQSVAEEDAVTTVDTGDAEEPVDVDVPAEAGESTTDAPTDAAPADAAPADAAATDDAAAAPATDGATPAEADTAAEAPAEPPAATERPEDGAAGSPQ